MLGYDRLASLRVKRDALNIEVPIGKDRRIKTVRCRFSITGYRFAVPVNPKHLAAKFVT